MYIKSPGIPPESRHGFRLERLIPRSIALALVISVAFLFTKRLLCSIICLLGSAIALTGFIMTIKLTDSFLRTGKGKIRFFLTELAKAVLIIIVFFFLASLSELAVVAYIAGLSVVILALMGEGVNAIRQTGHGNGN